MCFLKELHCELGLQLHRAKFVNSDVKEHFDTYVTRRVIFFSFQMTSKTYQTIN